jgi:uncharacterized membrane protein
MSPRVVVYGLMFVVSMVVGVLLGEWFFHLYVQALPPVAASTFNTQASRIAHLLYGAGVGVVIFIFTMFGAMADGAVRAMSKKPAPPPAKAT